MCHLQKHLPDFVNHLRYAVVELVYLGLFCHPAHKREAGDTQCLHMLTPLCWPLANRERTVVREAINMDRARWVTVSLNGNSPERWLNCIHSSLSRAV